MTRFRDLDIDQKVAFKELLLRGVDRRIREDIEYTSHVYRLLILGNGAGIALLAPFLGALASRGDSLSDLVSPLWKFLSGCVFAALIYAPLMSVASQATTHHVNQTVAFFKNEIDLESLQGWGLSKRGRWLVRTLALASLLCFSWAVYECIKVLKSFAT